MAKKTTLQLEDDDDVFNFELIALKTPNIEDYKLSFLLNKILGIQLKRLTDLAYLQKEEFFYSVYAYYDEANDVNYQLISNISIQKETQLQSNLLFDTATTQIYLFNELKNFNYLLKAEDQFNEQISLDLQNITEIIQFQFINIQKLKNKENLILNL